MALVPDSELIKMHEKLSRLEMIRKSKEGEAREKFKGFIAKDLFRDFKIYEIQKRANPRNTGAALLRANTPNPSGRKIWINVWVEDDWFQSGMDSRADEEEMNIFDSDKHVCDHEASMEFVRVRPPVPETPHAGIHIFDKDELIFRAFPDTTLEFDVVIHPDLEYLGNHFSNGPKDSPFPRNVLEIRNGNSESTGPKKKGDTSVGNGQRYYKYMIVQKETALDPDDLEKPGKPPYRQDPHLLDHDF